MGSTKNQLAKGVFWNALQMVVNQSFSFGLRLVLAKLLFPEQFGIVGMATVFTGFVQILTELGIGAALIQRKEEQLTPKHYFTAFWTGVIWSVLLFILMSLVVAPLAASFYGEPILELLIPVISIGILVSPVNLINKTQLTKKMDFKRIAKIDNFATISAGILSFILALNGAGVWALAFNSTAIIVISIPFYFSATKWYPKLTWSTDAFKDIFGFGVYATGTNIINYVISNIDYLLIGKLLNAQILGAYTLAFVLTDTFRNRLTAVMNNVMYPIYGEKQNDHSAIKGYYLKVIEYNSIVVYPSMTFMLVFASPFINAVFGDKWDLAVSPLRILAGSVIFSMMVNSNTVLIRGLGFARLELKLQVLKSIIFAPSLIAGIYYGGIIGASWVILLNKIFAVVLAQYTFNHLINIRITTNEFLRALRNPLIAGGVSLVIGYVFFLVKTNFVIGGIAMFSSYCIAIWFLMKNEIVNEINKIRKKRTAHQSVTCID